MRRKLGAAGAALIVSIGSLALIPTAAQAAASGSTLYVDNTSTCSDATTDSSVTPYCSIQAAANVVEPGQTVQIFEGTYDSHVTITRSGTAAAPIKFVGEGDTSNLSFNDQGVQIGGSVSNSTTGYGLLINGASNVEFTNVKIMGQLTGDVLVEKSSGIVLDHDSIDSGDTNGLIVGAGSSAVTIAQDYFIPDSTATGDAVEVDSGVSDTTITNDIAYLTGGGVWVDGASGTAVTGDTFYRMLGTGVQVDSGATGTTPATDTTIENDVVEPTKSGANAVYVDAPSAAGTTLDYNFVTTPATNTAALYGFGGAAYQTAAALDASTGQGAHDVNTGPGLSGTFAPVEGSPAINSGNASAPGEPATDFYGNTRALDPNDPVTGTGGGYYDRGAVQVVDPIKASLTAPTVWAAGSFTETFTAALTTAPWSSDVTYTYDFGDGATDTTTAATVTHTYTTPGTYSPKVTAVDADHGSVTAQSQEIELAGGNAYYPIAPTRVLDTRHGIGTATARVPADGSVKLKLAGVGGVPATGAVAVVLNVTVVAPTANGVITAYPDGTSVPTASNLNFLKGENRPNLVTVELGADGSVDLRNGGTDTADLVADLEGYYAPGTGTGFAGVQGYRSDEVTLTVGKPVLASAFYSGYSWLSTGAAAVAINITASAGTAAGYVSAYADGGKVSTASNVNYSANENIANMAIVPMGSDGYLDLIAGGKAGATVKVYLDVEGFYTNQPYTDGTGFVPTKPTRLIDTRSGLGVSVKGPTAGTEVDPTKLAGIPAHAAGIAANVTVVDPSANGYLSAYAFNELTATSTLNYAKAQNVANMAEFAWAPDLSGQYLYFNTSGTTTGIVLDMFGYFLN